MNKAAAWNIKGIDYDVRSAAREAARRSGMSLSEWLNSVIADRAIELGLDPEDFDEHDRHRAVSARLETLSEQGSRRNRRQNRPAAPQFYADGDAKAYQEASGQKYGDREYEDQSIRRRAAKNPMDREAPYKRPPRLHQPADHDDYQGYRQEPEYPAAYERTGYARQDPTVDLVQRRLASIEAAIENNSSASSNKDLRRTLSRLEARIETLATQADDGVAIGEEGDQASAFENGPIGSARQRGRNAGDQTREAAGQLQQKIGALDETLRTSGTGGADKELRRTLSRLEARIEALADSKEPETALNSIGDIDRKLNAITEMLARPAPEAKPVPEPRSEPSRNDHGSNNEGVRSPDTNKIAPAPEGVRPRELARIEAKLNMLLSREAETQAASQAAPVYLTPQRSAVSVARETAHDFADPTELRQASNLEPAKPGKRPLAEAIADIHNRQQVLDGGARTASSPRTLAAPKPGVSTIVQTPASRREDNAILRDDLQSIAKKLDDLRHLNQSYAQTQASAAHQASRQRADTDGNAQTSSAIEALGLQISQLNQAIAGLAPKDSIATVEKAIQALAARMDQPRSSPVDAKALQPMEALISDLKNSLSKQDAAQPQTQVVFDDLRNQLADVKHAVSKLAPKNSVSALEIAIRDLSRKVDTSRQEGVKDNILQPIEVLIADMKASLNNRPADPQLDTIEREMHTISQRMEQLGAAGAAVDDPRLQEIHEQTSTIKNLLSAAVNRPLPVEKIERQINALGKRIDLIASRGSSPVGAAAVSENVEEIRASLQQSYPAMEFSNIRDRIETLSDKFDAVMNSNAPDKHMHALSDRIDAVQQSIFQKLDRPSSASSESTRKLESLMLEIRDRLETTEKTAVAGAASRSVISDDFEKHIKSLAEKIDATASPIGVHHIAALEDNIQALAQKIDTVASGAGAEASAQSFARSHIAALEDNIRSLTEKMDIAVSDKNHKDPETGDAAQLQMQALEEHIRALTEKMDVVATAVSKTNAGEGSVNLDHLAVLEEHIRSLTDKVDMVSAGPDTTSLAALELQVRELAERIEHPNVSLQTLTTIEQTMSGLLNQFEEARLSSADAAEAAARNATREALDELLTRGALANIHNDDSRELISREISGLRSAQETKDLRTQATLSAVHETLEKVVDRLAMLEDNIDTKSAAWQAGQSSAGTLPPGSRSAASQH
ncbi:MAG: hypothetical protein NWT00_11565, partial [Beijerinckiaceae bacterium]|nr:hypothetical protein [Beijerinckiaceae bacterium]